MILQQLLKQTFRMFAQVKLKAILALSSGHFFISYGVLSLLGEKCADSFHQFLYFWVVTSSTVGYGDESPETMYGKLFVALFFIPFSLALFGLLLGKLGKIVSQHIRKEIMGKYRFKDEVNQILLMGYHPQRTHEQINLILADKKRKPRTIIVVTDQEMEHPFLDVKGVEFCKVDSLIDDRSLRDVALSAADKIMVEGTDDNNRYVLSTHYASVNKTAHITTHIKNSTISDNLQNLFPNVEVVEDNTDELMVRTMQDCGTSRAVSQLLRADKGQTFYVTSLSYDHDITVASIKNIVCGQGGIMLGIAYDSFGKSLVLNPEKSIVVEAATEIFIHYVADERLPAERFSSL